MSFSIFTELYNHDNQNLEHFYPLQKKSSAYIYSHSAFPLTALGNL